MLATLCLTPSIVALYMTLVKVDQIKTLFGCSLLFVAVPVNVFLVIVWGRLAYPVYDIQPTPAAYKLVLSTYYGGLHAVAIIMGVANLILALAIGKSAIGKPVAYLGFVVGVLYLVGSFPWLLGAALQHLCQLFFTGWFVILGMRMVAVARLQKVT